MLIRAALHTLSACPLFYALWLIVRTVNGDILALGADPGEELMEYWGEWAIKGLLVTLSISPIQTWLQVPSVRYRRLFGLWTFAYLCLHLTSYVTLVIGFSFSTLLEDLLDRPFIYVGMAGFLLLLPLAITSTRGWQLRLKRNWRRLHRLVYLAALLGIWHLYLQVRSDYTDFLVHAVILAVLLGLRLLPRERIFPQRSA